MKRDSTILLELKEEYDMGVDIFDAHLDWKISRCNQPSYETLWRGSSVLAGERILLIILS